MENLIFSLNATIPIFLMMVLGVFFRKTGLLKENMINGLNQFVFKATLPVLLFGDLAKQDFAEAWNGKFVAFCFVVTLVSISLVALMSMALKDKSQRGEFIQGAYRSSAAILGVAFIQNIYGTSGMAPLMIIGSVPLYNIFAVIILTFTSSDADKKGIRKACIGVLTNPIIIGIVLGMIASFFNIKFPGMVKKTISNMGVMTSPLALISIGATFRGREALAKIKPTLGASFIKLIGLAAVFMPLAIYMGFRDQKLIALLIMLASPCTPASYIMAKNMDGDAELASSIVVATTVLSAVTLTIWIFVLRSFGFVQ